MGAAPGRGRPRAPHGSDIEWIANVSRTMYRALLESGVRIFEWNGPMMHAKTAVADGRWSRIGSTNLNVSSWVGNWELDVGIEDEGIARQMEEIYLEDLDDATEIILTDRHQVRPEHPIAPGERAPAAGGSSSRMLTDAARMGGVLSAAVKGHRILGRPEASSLLVVGAVLFTLALLAVVLPRLTAYALAVVLGTAALAVLMKTVRLYFARSPEPDDTPHSDARPPG